MAQAEDTELRDLVVEALEKNGSLAKIRALLRANIFLAFEDECENMKQNVNLDNILKLPEGILALSIVHEFLEFCNLKNTLFVYMSESRQGRDYTYEGRKMLADRLHFLNRNHDLKEPVLLTFIKNVLRPYQRKYYEQGDVCSLDKPNAAPAANHKDDQNCTYIVHEDSSSSTSNSNSDNSSDEKKLHLKLPLDTSDTDTSSDSNREKSSEYIPNQHILAQINSDVEFSLNSPSKRINPHNESNLTSQVHETKDKNITHNVHELKSNIINSSDSTSYVDIKSYKQADQQNLSIPPPFREDEKTEKTPLESQSHPHNSAFRLESVSSGTLNSILSLSSPRNDNSENKLPKSNSRIVDESVKSDTEATEYSLDFTSSPPTKSKINQDQYFQSPEHVPDNILLTDKTSPIESPRQHSQSSQSSVSISDVADLIEYSDKNLLYEHNTSKENLSVNSQSKTSHKSQNDSKDQNKHLSEDSGDFSESPIPSVSNLSLDVHSD